MIKENLILLKWDKLGQKHQLRYIYGDGVFSDSVDRIHDHYTFILSVVTKYCFTKRYNRFSMEQCITRVSDISNLELKILHELKLRAVET